MESYDWLFDNNGEEEKPEEVIIDEPCWTTREGVKIPLSKMTSRHIVNCLKFISKKHPWRAALLNELEKRKKQPLKGDFSL
jgi:hypothetical protein